MLCPGTGSFIIVGENHTELIYLVVGLYHDAIQALVHIANKILIKCEKNVDYFGFVSVVM